MKYLIASDIHGSLSAAKKLVETSENECVDEIVLLGDLYYHGPRNPLPEEYAPMKVAEILNSINNLTVIRGNCDSEVDEMISSFPFLESVVLFSAGKKIFLTHGHKFNEDNVPTGCRALIYGHFHTGFIKEKDDVILANPGSASLPKNDTPKSYLILEEDVLTLKSLEGKVLAERKID